MPVLPPDAALVRASSTEAITRCRQNAGVASDPDRRLPQLLHRINRSSATNVDFLFSRSTHRARRNVFANNPELKVEQTADGEMVFMSPTGGDSGIQNSETIAALLNRARGYSGIVFDLSTLFRLPNGVLRSPDVSWIQAARWQSLTDQE